MAKSKFFRVAVEGATATDGRTIEKAWIQQMAAGYNPATYTARVNLEHIRGVTGQAPFKAYGDVLAVEAREIDLELNGKTEKRLALYAQIDPTDDLVALTKARQKIFTSIEVAPDFAKTGKAGLVGLAATDSPASLGTDILAFSTTGDNAAAAAIKADLDRRKTDPANLFSAAQETSIELEPEPKDEPSLKELFTTALREVFGKKEPEKTATQPAAQPPADANAALLTAMEQGFTKVGDAVEKRLNAFGADLAALRTDHNALKGKLDTTEKHSTPRTPSSGGANQVLTDC